MAISLARAMEIKKMSFSQTSQLSDEEFAIWEEHRTEQNVWDLITEYEDRTCVPQEY